MNKKLLTLLGSAAFALTITSCGSQTVTVPTKRVITALPTEIRVTHQHVSLRTGESEKLNVYLAPRAAHDAVIRYESDNPSVATVSPDGTVTAVGGGICGIRCYTTGKDNNVIETVVKVYVTRPASFNEVQTNVLGQLLKQQETGNELKNFKAQNYAIREKTKAGELYYAYYDDCDYLHYSNNNEGRAGFIGYQKEINTTGGTMEETNYAWQTYCDNDYKTYIYHDTGFTKNYCNYDTSEFIGKDKLEPCLEFLNGMFTNGKVILTQHLKIIKQETLLGYFNDPQASSQIAAETSNYGVYTDSETGLTMCRFTLTEGDNGTEAPEDEDLDGIPSGTSYRGSFTMDLTFVNGYLRVDHTINPITYKLDGVDYTKLRDEYTAYQINDEVVVPRPVNADYIPVEDIFDL